MVSLRIVQLLGQEVHQECKNLQDEFGLWGDDLAGMCFIASCMLYNKMKNVGFQPKIAFGIGHVFILWRGLIVDPTACQFYDALPCEIIDPRKETLNGSFHQIRPRLIFNSFEEVKEKHQDFNQWECNSPEQCPHLWHLYHNG